MTGYVMNVCSIYEGLQDLNVWMV